MTIDDVKTNSYPVGAGAFLFEPGIFLNEAGAVAMINLLAKYRILSEIKDAGEKLVTNLETQIVYQDRYITNVVTETKIVKEIQYLEDKKEDRLSLFFALGGYGVGFTSGLFILSDNAGLSQIGIIGAVTGALLVVAPRLYFYVKDKYSWRKENEDNSYN